jgi:AhpD family alkylhydroperoxidase
VSEQERLSVREVSPAAIEAVLGMERFVRSGSLEPSLIELIKIRSSQINGCAYCLDMHNRDARERGETQRRLDVLSAWREVHGLFSERERAALAFTEAVTRLPVAGVPDPVWEAAATQFSESEMVQLLMAVTTINVWNRLSVSTRQQPPFDASELQPAAAAV